MKELTRVEEEILRVIYDDFLVRSHINDGSDFEELRLSPEEAKNLIKKNSETDLNDFDIKEGLHGLVNKYLISGGDWVVPEINPDSGIIFGPSPSFNYYALKEKGYKLAKDSISRASQAKHSQPNSYHFHQGNNSTINFAQDQASITSHIKNGNDPEDQLLLQIIQTLHTHGLEVREIEQQHIKEMIAEIGKAPSAERKNVFIRLKENLGSVCNDVVAAVAAAKILDFFNLFS